MMRAMFVSATPTSASNANASTARAVYGPDTRQGQQLVERAGQRSVVTVDADPSRQPEVPSSPRIPETLPTVQHLGELRRRARRRIRVRLQEVPVPVEHSRDLGLLEHHLADEHRPGVARVERHGSTRR